MTVEKQCTLAGEIVLSGIGLHSGESATVTLRPAPANSGLALRSGGAEEKLRPSLAKAAGHCNTIHLSKETGVMTVEHLLSALVGMGVDNAVIEVDGKEIPGLDGSALEFAKAVSAVGLTTQEADRSVFIPKAPVSVGSASAGIVAYPSPDGEFSITYILDYKESRLAQGSRSFKLSGANYLEEIAPARTFVMQEHVDRMLAAGLGKGANHSNTIVLDGDRVVDNQLRFPDECIRHKILDLMGDLAILNRRLGVHIIASKSGHTQNCELAAALAREIIKVENPHGIMDIREIMDCLPHRYPFLLIDRILELEEKKRVVALKNMTGNEHFFQGHFPGQPIMPGVLQIEALAQAGAIMMLGEYRGKGKLAVLMSAEGIKWRRQVVPGDCLHLHAEAEKMKGRIGVVRTWATVDDEVTVEATIKFALIDADQPS